MATILAFSVGHKIEAKERTHYGLSAEFTARTVQGRKNSCQFVFHKTSVLRGFGQNVGSWKDSKKMRVTYLENQILLQEKHSVEYIKSVFQLAVQIELQIQNLLAGSQFRYSQSIRWAFKTVPGGLLHRKLIRKPTQTESACKKIIFVSMFEKFDAFQRHLMKEIGFDSEFKVSKNSLLSRSVAKKPRKIFSGHNHRFIQIPEI